MPRIPCELPVLSPVGVFRVMSLPHIADAHSSSAPGRNSPEKRSGNFIEAEDLSDGLFAFGLSNMV